MPNELCLNCMCWHPPPPCRHDSTKPCPHCGLPFGYLMPNMSPAQCWFCLTGRPRASPPSLPPAADPETELTSI